MIYAFIILAAFTPVFLWFKYFHDRVGIDMAPIHLWAAFLAGMTVTYPGLVIENFLGASPPELLAWTQDVALVRAIAELARQAPNFVSAYVGVSLFEEALKFTAVLFLLRSLGDRPRPKSLIITAVVVAGAFAGMENVLYSLKSADWERTAVLRGLLSVPNHVTLGAIMGVFLALALRGRHRRLMITLALLVPAMLHGTTNYALSLSAPMIDSPADLDYLVARPLYGALLIAQLLFAGAAITWVEKSRRRAPEINGMRPVPFSHHDRGLRSGFWRRISFILGVFGLINLVIVVFYSAALATTSNLGRTFIIGGLSILYALVIWGSARVPATARP